MACGRSSPAVKVKRSSPFIPTAHRSGLTLLEVLLCLGLAALLVVIVYPGWERSGLREKGRKLKEDLEMIEKAVDAVAKEERLTAGTVVAVEQYRKRLKKGSALEKTGMDPFGTPYGPQKAEVKPSVPKTSAEMLQDVVPTDFWDPFPVDFD